MKQWKIAAILIVSLAASCKLGSKSTDAFPPDQSMPPDFEVRLVRTQCYGTCPAYELTVGADGSVIFKGNAHTLEKEGTWKIDETTIQRLINEFKNADYFDYENEYSFDNCPSTATDMATVTTSIRLNGKTKKVSHYLGCSNADHKPFPPGLRELENEIDAITGSRRWIEMEKF
jgi:hypothetical protein